MPTNGGSIVVNGVSENLIKDLSTIIDRTKDQLLRLDDLSQFAISREDPRLLDLARGFAAYERYRRERTRSGVQRSRI